MKRWRRTAGTAELAVLVAGLVLIGLIWLGTVDALRTEERAAVAHQNAELANKALLFETQLRRQLLAIDQTLHILEGEWERDPASFDLAFWHRRAKLLADLAAYIYLTDAQGIIRASTRPDLIGVNVSTLEGFRNRATLGADDGEMFIAPPTTDPHTHQWEIGLVRRLDTPEGRFAGVIGLGYHATVIGSFFAAAELGSHGTIALIGTGHGRIYASAGAAGLEPGGSIDGSPMFSAIRNEPDGLWTGAPAPAGQVRLYALRRVAERPLEVVLGVDPEQALASHYAWQRGARIFAGFIVLFLLLIMALLMRELRAARRREAKLAQDQMALEELSAQQAAARQVAEARSAQLAVTLLGMSDGVSMVDADLRLVQWNALFCEYTGVPADLPYIGLPMVEILRAQAKLGEFGPVDVEAEVARRMARLQVGSQMGVTERSRPDGRILELRRRSLPTGGIVTLYSDITERKWIEHELESAREIAEAAAADKSRFVAIVSHEIRTPLNTLLNALTLLSEGDLPASQRGVLGIARQSGDALLGLLGDILEMSRADAGQLTLRPGIFALRPLLEGVLEIFHDEAATRGIVLGLDVSAGVPDTLYSDAGRLRQVIMNLVSNAVKYSRPGAIRLQAVTWIRGGRTILRLGLRDRGPAIDPADHPRLFQAFTRLDQQSAPLRTGTGLGLVICQRLTTLLGGEIGYLPAAEDSNEFWITLPILAAPTDGAVARSPVSCRVLPRTRVLLVDDIVANRAIVATLLRREGHMVDVAGDGAAAIAAVRQAPYDIVLMDIFMPGINGLAATRALRGLGGIAAAVPIVALTANTGAEETASCIAAGMSDVLRKPADIATLLAAIARYAWPGNSASGPGSLPDGTSSPSTGVSPQVEASAAPVLDRARLTELRGSLAPGVLAALVDQCVRDLAIRLPTLNAAIAAGRSEQIEAEVHAMVGMAASYAMAMLEARLRRVLLAVRNRDDAGARVAAMGLDADLARTDAALRSVVSSVPA